MELGAKLRPSRWLKQWRDLLLSRKEIKTERPGLPAVAAAPSPAPAAPIEGSHRGWLRVLNADDLLTSLRADDALEGLWRQSRLASNVWERDLLTAVRHYAEFVQLMPASESHHHAHVGGLLAHTLEMTLAAVTWRNGHLLPAGATIEQIDEERDVWTYVVFFAALLHDIAKPLTDLRIQWRAAQMPEPLRWTPVAGSLVQLAHGRTGAEYLVEFTPKSLRDYGAHSKLALTLLGQIAPPTALSFMARTPQAMDQLTQYLSGLDKTSLVARIVSRADQASTQKALASGSRARFETATSVPLIELLMNALKSMLRIGTALPLNRSGAAGWVHDGSVWLVAKRLADAVRAWIRQNAPDESIPGDNKNDRLFDTWQEYACIQPNPHSGQAVWYVVVHGQASAQESAAGEGVDAAQAEEGATYSHSLTVLRFPLEKLYDDPAQYPPAMTGRIEIKDKRPSKEAAEASDNQSTETTTDPHTAPLQISEHQTATQQTNGAHSTAAERGQQSTDSVEADTVAKPKPSGPKPMRAPGFNQPKAAAAAVKNSKPGAGKPAGHPAQHAARPVPQSAVPARSSEITIGGGIDGFDLEDDGWLDDDDDVRVAVQSQPPKPAPIKKEQESAAKPRPAAQPVAQPPEAAKPTNKPLAKPSPPARPKLPKPEPVAARSVVTEDHQSMPGETTPAARTTVSSRMFSAPTAGPATRATPDPVVLVPRLPELPQQAASRKAEPSETALAFLQWLQQGLASREIKYNETGAPVHFTAEGMALVSPLIFKHYARETGPESESDMTGLQVQREVLKAGWHLMVAGKGKGKVNIVSYEVVGRAGVAVGKLSAVVLTDPDRFVLPVPPANPVLKLL